MHNLPKPDFVQRDKKASKVQAVNYDDFVARTPVKNLSKMK